MKFHFIYFSAPCAVTVAGDGMITITASTEGEGITRTTLQGDDANGYQVIWSEGDQMDYLSPLRGM